MSSTACWGTNKLVSCANVFFRYGSRWELLTGAYYRGFQLSLEALCIFAYYDHPYKQAWPFFEDYVINDFRPTTADWYTETEWNRLKPETRNIFSPVYIQIPNSENIEQWISATHQASGGFHRDNPEYREVYPNLIEANGSPAVLQSPSLERGISKINPIHAQIISRAFEMNERACASCAFINTWYGKISRKEYEEQQIELDSLINDL